MNTINFFKVLNEFVQHIDVGDHHIDLTTEDSIIGLETYALHIYVHIRRDHFCDVIDQTKIVDSW